MIGIPGQVIQLERVAIGVTVSVVFSTDAPNK